MDYIIFPEGRILPNGGGFAYEYHLKDHLGSVRVAFTPTTSGKTVVQENAYYPFGATINDLSWQVSYSNKYGYNGKEKLDYYTGMQQYDYSARFYNPLTARWGVIDPMAEKYYGISPYAYCNNNPIRHVDPDGRDWKEWFQNLLNLLGLNNILQQTPGERVANAEKREAVNSAIAETAEKVEPLADAMETTIETVFPVAGNMFVKAMKNETVSVGEVAIDAGLEISLSVIPGGKIVKEGVEAAGKKVIKEVGEELVTKTLQTGGHTLNNSTLKALELTKQQGNRAIEALKKAEGILPNQHGKIMSNGDYVINNVVMGNLYDYIP